VWGQFELYSALYTVQHYPQYQTALGAAEVFCNHDPTFILPALIIPLNYLMLNNSTHPFLINIREGWTPLFKLLASVYISFGFIILP